MAEPVRDFTAVTIADVAVGTILVVDDDDGVRRVVSRLLKRAGFGVIEADGGVAALGIFRERGDQIVLVVLDATMPDMDGMATFRALRRIRSDLPVLFMSGHSEEDIATLLVGEWGVQYMMKPFSRDRLTQMIQATLKQEKPPNRYPT